MAISLLNKFWNISPKKIVQAISQKLMLGKANPKWVAVESGPLEGGQLYIDPDNCAAWKEMATGSFDGFIYQELESVNLNGAVFWDIGAHFGYHSFSFASLIGDTGFVYAFEPNPFNIIRFNMHMSKNPLLARRILLSQIALSNADGEFKFIFSEDVDGSTSSGSHLENAKVPLDSATYSQFKEEAVKCLSVDSFIMTASPRNPNFIKIDVEGAEMLVLLGANKLIENCRPTIFMEVHNISLMYYVYKYFADSGYSVKILDEENATLSKCFIVARPQLIEIR